MIQQADRERFHREGYLAPRRLLDEAEALALGERCYEAMALDPRAPGPTSAYLFAWHHRHRWAWELATHPRLLDLVETVLGPNLVLWAMACWYKEPLTGKRVPWHQDAQYWPMSPSTTASVWLALGPTSRANGCLRIIPGSHTTKHEHRAIADATSWFDRGADDTDEHGAIDLAMAPGEAALFDEGILHGSDVNRSELPRLGISFRYSPPDVRFHSERWGGDASRIRTFLVRGEDRLRLNEGIRGTPPA
jgi:ectoine hydroxylase-related dioxygenase (phytanoyl-CoA dioxygenase family)